MTQQLESKGSEGIECGKGKPLKISANTQTILTDELTHFLGNFNFSHFTQYKFSKVDILFRNYQWLIEGEGHGGT